MNKTKSAIRTAVIGLGRSGYNIHLKALRKLPEKYQLVAIADSWEERVLSAAKELNITGYHSLEDILLDDRIEIVIIAVPNHLHAKYSIAALNAGKHVICEKPFGLTASDVDSMFAAAQASGVTITAFHSRRYESVFRKICSIITSGILGRITHIRMNWGGFGHRWDWQTLKEFEGGQINNTCPHAMDQALHLFAAAGVTDYENLNLFADLKNTMAMGDAEDHVRITLRAPGTGLTLDIELFATQAYPSDRWMVCGTSGGLRGDLTAIEWKWIDGNHFIGRISDKHSYKDRSYCQENLNWQTESFVATDSFSDWQRLFYEDFYTTIREGASPAISSESARAVVKMLERIRKYS